jgi:hypothetical protein
VCLPETKRLLQGSAAGRAAGGGGGAKAETENSRRNPLRAAAAISMQSPLSGGGQTAVRRKKSRLPEAAATTRFISYGWARARPSPTQIYMGNVHDISDQAQTSKLSKSALDLFPEICRWHTFRLPGPCPKSKPHQSSVVPPSLASPSASSSLIHPSSTTTALTTLLSSSALSPLGLNTMEKLHHNVTCSHQLTSSSTSWLASRIAAATCFLRMNEKVASSFRVIAPPSV